MTRRAVLLLAALPALTARAAPEDPPLAWGEPRRLCLLGRLDLRESSGVACSRRRDGLFWTHNDSGDKPPRVFAFDRAGLTRALEVEGAKNKDWEDIASFVKDERAWLLVADTGDNGASRKEVQLYLLEEPERLPPLSEPQPTLSAKRRVAVRYEDGPHDCEGVAVDVPSGLVLLVSKVHGDRRPAVYAVPLEALLGHQPDGPLEAKKLATLDPAVPGLTTGMDVSPDGRRLVVCTYADAYAWGRAEEEPWSEALTRAPVRVPLPERSQGEAICFGQDGRSLILTSEGSMSQVWELPPGG